MAKIIAGHVVYVEFPYTDRSKAKERPVLVLASVGMRDWVVCEITSKIQKHDEDIPLNRSDMQTGTLGHDSCARPGRLLTLHEDLLEKHIWGQVTNRKLVEVTNAVRALF